MSDLFSGRKAITPWLEKAVYNAILQWNSNTTVATTSNSSFKRRPTHEDRTSNISSSNVMPTRLMQVIETSTSSRRRRRHTPSTAAAAAAATTHTRPLVVQLSDGAVSVVAVLNHGCSFDDDTTDMAAVPLSAEHRLVAGAVVRVRDWQIRVTVDETSNSAGPPSARTHSSSLMQTVLEEDNDGLFRCFAVAGRICVYLQVDAAMDILGGQDRALLHRVTPVLEALDVRRALMAKRDELLLLLTSVADNSATTVGTTLESARSVDTGESLTMHSNLPIGDVASLFENQEAGTLTLLEDMFACNDDTAPNFTAMESTRGGREAPTAKADSSVSGANTVVVRPSSSSDPPIGNVSELLNNSEMSQTLGDLLSTAAAQLASNETVCCTSSSLPKEAQPQKGPEEEAPPSQNQSRDGILTAPKQNQREDVMSEDSSCSSDDEEKAQKQGIGNMLISPPKRTAERGTSDKTVVELDLPVEKENVQGETNARDNHCLVDEGIASEIPSFTAPDHVLDSQEGEKEFHSQNSDNGPVYDAAFSIQVMPGSQEPQDTGVFVCVDDESKPCDNEMDGLKIQRMVDSPEMMKASDVRSACENRESHDERNDAPETQTPTPPDVTLINSVVAAGERDGMRDNEDSETQPPAPQDAINTVMAPGNNSDGSRDETSDKEFETQMPETQDASTINGIVASGETDAILDETTDQDFETQMPKMQDASASNGVVASGETDGMRDETNEEEFETQDRLWADRVGASFEEQGNHDDRKDSDTSVVSSPTDETFPIYVPTIHGWQAILSQAGGQAKRALSASVTARSKRQRKQLQEHPRQLNGIILRRWMKCIRYNNEALSSSS